MANNSTNMNETNNHRSHSQVLAWGWHKIVAGLSWLIGSLFPHIYKQMIKTCKDSFQLKKTTN